MGTIASVIPPIHREGYVFIAIFAIVSLLLMAIAEPLGWLGFIATAWCIYFFRDPVRITPVGDNWVISPADGMVQRIQSAIPPLELEMGMEELTRISIFLNVFNVHVNRVPASGIITRLHYHPGKFLNASLDKASEDNERQSVLMQTVDGREIAFVQIAGLVARRIVCDLKERQSVKAGEHFGIIRFGSRMDVYLPRGVHPLVVEGQTVIAGETVLANLESDEMARNGEIR